MEWDRNIWTGNHIAHTSKGRIIRLDSKPPLYYAEYWGDYGPEFPKRGPAQRSMQAALRDLRELRR